MFKIVVDHPYASSKVAHNWPAGGMSPDNHRSWKEVFIKTVQNNQNSGELQEALKSGKQLEIAIGVYGKANRIKPLDLDGVATQIFTELMNYFFPRPKGKPVPCTQDRHFWKLSVTKTVADQERLEIAVRPIS